MTPKEIGRQVVSGTRSAIRLAARYEYGELKS